MNSRTRGVSLAVSFAIAAPITLALAQPAFASGGHGGGTGGGNGGGGGKSAVWTCSAPTTSTLPGITTQSTIAVGAAGSAVLKRDASNDGLVVGTVTAASGWGKSVPTPSGPKVTVQFQQSHNKVELEAAQSALYYGPTVLVTEVTSCTR